MKIILSAIFSFLFLSGIAQSKIIIKDRVGCGTSGVTSVGLTMPTGLTVTGSPITATGTLAVTTTLNGIIKGTGSGFGTVSIGTGLTYDGTTLSATGTGGTVTSVGLSMPSAFTVTNSPVTTTGTLTVTGAGTTAQYIRGDGSLSTFATDARTSISLTTTGTSGVATYNNSTGVLNVPNYGAASGTLFAVSGQDATATQVRSFNGASFNFTISSVDSFTLSGNRTVVEGINELDLISTSAISELSSGSLLDKGVTANYLATTTAGWGYASASSVTLGLTATSTALTGVGLTFSVDAQDKLMRIDTVTGQIRYGIASVNIGGTGQTSYTDGQLLIGNSTGNTLTKATLSAGSGITITNGGGSITIAAINAGTVTTFSAGNLSPLFTTSVATASSTPSLTFSLTNAAAGTVFGNATASAAAPSYTTHPIIGVASGSTGILGISGTTSGTVSLSTADAAGTWTMKLPTTGGSNLFFLQTDGSGNTTWAAPFTLTTTGTSGAATFSSGTLNIPQYSGGSISLSAIGSSPNANAATLTGTVLNLEAANASFGGVVTTATQTFAGDKTLTGNTFLTGTVQTNATTENGNFNVQNTTSIGAQTSTARYEVASQPTEYRVAIGSGSTNPTLTANGNYASVVIPLETVTEASSGTHNHITQLALTTPTVTNAGASVTRTSALFINSGGTGATGATNYGIYNVNAVNFLGGGLTTSASTTTNNIAVSTGVAGFGAGGANVNLYVQQAASNTTNNTIGLNTAVTQSATSGTATAVGINSSVLNTDNGSAVATSYIGFRSAPGNSGTGTVTNLIGYDVTLGLSGSSASTSGTVTNGYGFKAEDVTRLDSSKFTNYYSYYADSVIKFWGVTNAIYGYYQVGTHMLNFFAGNTIHGYNGGVNTGSQLQTTSFSVGYKATAVDYTATTTDNTIEVTATGKTVTLPTAVGCQGRIYRVKLTASGSGTVATTSSQNIDASTTYSLSAQYKYVEVVSNNVGWIVVANN